jgi:GNAT superfamily N-acetyltransferase
MSRHPPVAARRRGEEDLSVSVRPAREADIPAMAAVASASYRVAFAGILPADVLAERSPGHFHERFAETWPRMMVAEQDGSIVAFSLTTDVHIDMLFVDPARLGRGAGIALLRAAERAGAATLECFADNAPARAFYAHAGWRLTKHYEREFAGGVMRFVLFERPAPPVPSPAQRAGEG